MAAHAVDKLQLRLEHVAYVLPPHSSCMQQLTTRLLRLSMADFWIVNRSHELTNANFAPQAGQPEHLSFHAVARGSSLASKTNSEAPARRP